MKEIKLNNEVVALVHLLSEWKEGLDFITADEHFIQAGTWWYQDGKELRSHRHIINERIVSRTQETVVVISGCLQIDLYDESNSVFHNQILRSGDMAVILNVGHGYKILDNNTRVIEVKNGPFFSVEKDKQFI